MNPLRKLRFSMALVMMLVVTSAAASALFAKVYRYVPDTATQAYLKIDAPVLFLLAIILTATALGAIKSHSAGQTMLQITVACLAYLSLIGLAESGQERPLLYWFQGGFGLLVTVPLLARRLVKTEMERGPRRTLWKKRCESIVFAFLTMMLVLLGILLEFMTAQMGQLVKP